MNIRELLRGTKTGRMQSVGLMSVIPLISDMDDDDRFEAPTALWVQNRNYGEIQLENKDAVATIAPVGATYLTKQSAQDHAVMGAVFVPGKKRVDVRDAACVQSSQGGHINQEQTEMLILPYALRESAMGKIGVKEYGKLWSDIGKFNQLANCANSGEHLEYFVKTHEKTMNQFVAEFEIVPNQVGAIILINGKVHGIERAPNFRFWRGVWTPLIRMCYGSQAIIAGLKQKEVKPTMTPIQTRGVNSLDALADALDTAEQKDVVAAEDIVRSLLEDQFETKNEKDHSIQDENGSSTIKQRTVENDQFIGQTFTDGPQVCYASVVTKTGWMKHSGWRGAKAFAI